MARLIFFLTAYPIKRKLQFLALLIFEALKVSTKTSQEIFGKSLVESRAILGFVYDNQGKIEQSSDQWMKISFVLKTQRVSLKLRWQSSDFLVFEQVLVKKEYSPLLEFKLRKDLIILDGGANVGFTSIYFKCCLPDARIIAIEPDPDNFKMLTENINMNRLPGVECLNYALWHSNEYVHLDRNAGDSRDWSIRISDSGMIKVKSKTLSALFEELNIDKLDVLKMDIEGAELEIFERDENIDSVLDCIDVVALEVHGDSNKMIEKKLKSKGFHFFINNETIFASKVNG